MFNVRSILNKSAGTLRLYAISPKLQFSRIQFYPLQSGDDKLEMRLQKFAPLINAVK
jgi:hypothetical protein